MAGTILRNSSTPHLGLSKFYDLSLEWSFSTPADVVPFICHNLGAHLHIDSAKLQALLVSLLPLDHTLLFHCLNFFP